jgi:hypothetical protein
MEFGFYDYLVLGVILWLLIGLIDIIVFMFLISDKTKKEFLNNDDEFTRLIAFFYLASPFVFIFLCLYIFLLSLKTITRIIIE